MCSPSMFVSSSLMCTGKQGCYCLVTTTTSITTNGRIFLSGFLLFFFLLGVLGVRAFSDDDRRVFAMYSPGRSYYYYSITFSMPHSPSFCPIQRNDDGHITPITITKLSMCGPRTGSEAGKRRTSLVGSRLVELLALPPAIASDQLNMRSKINRQ